MQSFGNSSRARQEIGVARELGGERRADHSNLDAVRGFPEDDRPNENTGRQVRRDQGGAPASGAPVVQVPCSNGPGMTGSLLREGDAYRIRNTSSGLCVSSSDDERRRGGATTVVQRPCGEPGQLWRIQLVNREADRVDVRFNLNGQEIPDDCMNINGESTDDDAHVVRWPCGSRPADNSLFRVSVAALPP